MPSTMAVRPLPWDSPEVRYLSMDTVRFYLRARSFANRAGGAGFQRREYTLAERFTSRLAQADGRLAPDDWARTRRRVTRRASRRQQAPRSASRRLLASAN